jgi:4-hydroxy-tetrahydrodipicolinate reductase
VIRVVLSGATGKVGQVLAPAIEADPEFDLAAACAPSLGTTLESALAAGGVDAVVDFTTADAARSACDVCIGAGIPLVLGTSGLGEDGRRDVDAAARSAGVPVLEVPNFAIGAVLMMRFAEAAYGLLDRAHIVELHADSKRDAPSGTARATAARMGADVPISSVRLPGLVAHQEVILGGPGETLTIRHDTSSREAFVPGVLLALRRVRSLPPGVSVGLEPVLDGLD